MILNQHVDVWIVVDTKDLFNSLSTKRNSIDNSIFADANVIRFEFKCCYVNSIIWISGSVNLADTGKKSKSPVADALQLLQFSVKIPQDFFGHESAYSDRSLG